MDKQALEPEKDHPVVIMRRCVRSCFGSRVDELLQNMSDPDRNVIPLQSATMVVKVDLEDNFLAHLGYSGLPVR